MHQRSRNKLKEKHVGITCKTCVPGLHAGLAYAPYIQDFHMHLTCQARMPALRDALAYLPYAKDTFTSLVATLIRAKGYIYEVFNYHSYI